MIVSIARSNRQNHSEYSVRTDQDHRACWCAHRHRDNIPDFTGFSNDIPLPEDAIIPHFVDMQSYQVRWGIALMSMVIMKEGILLWEHCGMARTVASPASVLVVMEQGGWTIAQCIYRL